MQTYAIANGDKVEKYHVAYLFDSSTTDTPAWKQLSKTTENIISLNPETEDREFITDKNPTTLVKRYKPSLNTPLTLFKGEDDYEYFWAKFYKLPTGAAANGTMLVVFLNDATTSDGSTTYKAWKVPVTFVFDSLDAGNSQLTINVNFNGTIAEGTVAVDNSGNPTFTAA